MSLRITPETTTCNGVDLPSAEIAELLAMALGIAWRTCPLFMGGDWYSDDRGSERSASLYSMQPNSQPAEALASREYSALIRAICASPAFTEARMRHVAPPTNADAVVREFKRRIDAAMAGKRDSILSYGISLNGLVAIGLAGGKTIEQALTAEQRADVAIIWAIDAWETEMIETREALIELSDATYADDAHWPAKPAGLTAEWLKAF